MKGDVACAKMWLITVICKLRGCRSADIVRLCWNQLTRVDNEIVFKPKVFKNKRYSGRWMFSIKIEEGEDNIQEALDLVKMNAKDKSKSGKIFDNWTTSQVTYYFDKYSSKIGENLTCHRIRVLTCLALTKIGWSDSSIKSFLNWRSSESLETYRTGFSVEGMREDKSILNAYSSKLVAASVRDWKYKFGNKI